MNLIKYRMLLDKKIDLFAKENYNEIFEKDNMEDINARFEMQNEFAEAY